MPLLSGLLRVWRAERGLARLLRVLSRISERYAGLFRASMIGWPDGFVGVAPRVIGTAFISTGTRCSVGRFAWIEVFAISGRPTPSLELGARFSASERLHIACSNRVVFGVDCLLGSGVHVTDHNHGSYKGTAQSHPDEPPIKRSIVSGGPVVIGDRVWIGDNCVIIGPVQIGEGAVVAANSVVTANVPPRTIVAGSPARVIKRFNPIEAEWVRESQFFSDGHEPLLVIQ